MYDLNNTLAMQAEFLRLRGLSLADAERIKANDAPGYADLADAWRRFRTAKFNAHYQKGIPS